MRSTRIGARQGQQAESPATTTESPAAKTVLLAAPESSLPRHRIRVAASGRQGQVVASESPSPSLHIRITESSPPSRLVRV